MLDFTLPSLTIFRASHATQPFRWSPSAYWQVMFVLPHLSLAGPPTLQGASEVGAGTLPVSIPLASHPSPTERFTIP